MHRPPAGKRMSHVTWIPSLMHSCPFFNVIPSLQTPGLRINDHGTTLFTRSISRVSFFCVATHCSLLFFIISLPFYFWGAWALEWVLVDYSSTWVFSSSCFLPAIVKHQFTLSDGFRERGFSSCVWATHAYNKDVFGCKEVSGSKKMGKYNCSLPYLSKHRKKKIRKPPFLLSFLFYTTIFSLPECYS